MQLRLESSLGLDGFLSTKAVYLWNLLLGITIGILLISLMMTGLSGPFALLSFV
jgi:hypothetical protein